MAISINGSNSFSNINSFRNDPTQPSERISSGQRINSAADDAAGLAISNRLTTQQDGFSVAIRNAGDGVSLAQVADGALSSLSGNLQRIRELALQSANGSLNDSDRQALQQEAGQLVEETRSVLERTSFNGVKLFDNENQLNFQTGPNAGDQISVSASNLLKTLEDGGLSDLSVASSSQANTAISSIDSALESINSVASEFGAVTNRFESTIENLSQARENTAAANSRIADADIAAEATDLIRRQIGNQVDIAIQAQANSNQKNVLSLLSGL